MPKIQGASARHPQLSSFEPEAVDALAIVALRLIDVINRGKIARTDQADKTTTDLIDASYQVLDAARGDSTLIPAAVDRLLADEGAHRAAVAITPYEIRVRDSASMLKVCSEAFGWLSGIFGAISKDPDCELEAKQLAGAGRSIAEDLECRSWDAAEDLRTGGNP